MSNTRNFEVEFARKFASKVKEYIELYHTYINNKKGLPLNQKGLDHGKIPANNWEMAKELEVKINAYVVELKKIIDLRVRAKTYLNKLAFYQLEREKKITNVYLAFRNFNDLSIRYDIGQMVAVKFTQTCSPLLEQLDSNSQDALINYMVNQTLRYIGKGNFQNDINEGLSMPEIVLKGIFSKSAPDRFGNDPGEVRLYYEGSCFFGGIGKKISGLLSQYACDYDQKGEIRIMPKPH